MEQPLWASSSALHVSRFRCTLAGNMRHAHQEPKQELGAGRPPKAKGKNLRPGFGQGRACRRRSGQNRRIRELHSARTLNICLSQGSSFNQLFFCLDPRRGKAANQVLFNKLRISGFSRILRSGAWRYFPAQADCRIPLHNPPQKSRPETPQKEPIVLATANW